MSEPDALTICLGDLARRRHWKRFHNPRNLAAEANAEVNPNEERFPTG